MTNHKSQITIHKKIPLSVPSFNGNEWKYVKECLDTEWVSSAGKYVELFEDKVSKYTGSKFAVGCVNGTSALHISLLISGVEGGHEIITQPLTFVSICNAISYCNAVPIFIDVDKDTMGMSPESLEYFLENFAK